MSKAIATPIGKPTKRVELTQAETDARNAEIIANKAKSLADAPYARLAEIDVELTDKLTRMIEDISKSQPFDSSVQALLDEKETIRSTL